MGAGVVGFGEFSSDGARGGRRLKPGKRGKGGLDRGCDGAGLAYSAAPAMNDLRIKPFDFQAAVARAGLQPNGLPRADGVGAAAGGGFKTAMADALKQVSGSQMEASRLQREVALDNPNVSIEETMVAMQKAQIGFQGVIQVRNRLVSAYTEIMNMQV
jgi:flagellar hook-basal body complex protein FliE